MDTQNEAFMKRLLETFRQEAKEHIENLSNGLLELEKSSDNSSKSLIETLFREAHSFKGASRAVNISEIEELCKAMEDIFSHYKESEQKIPNSLIEIMLEGNDILDLLSKSDEIKRRELKPKVQEVIEALHKEPSEKKSVVEKESIVEKASEETKAKVTEEVVQKESRKSENSQVSQEKVETKETIRIPIKKLNAIMQQSEEMLFAKIISKHHVDDLLIIAEEVAELNKSLQNSKDSTHEILKKLTVTESHLNRSIKQAQADRREVNLMVDRLINEMKEALMLPFSTIFSTLPKIVHDMAKSVDKDISVNILGGEIEVDRRILEQMHDPIVHLLRNSIDHGIQESGLITLTLTQISASKIELSIRDNGSGIDVDKIAQNAVKRGIIDQEGVDALDEESLLRLIFYSGISTAKVVTDLSGRGLGLAIVLEKTEQLGGKVDVYNMKEGGSEFKIVLPITMATFRGVVTSILNQKFIFSSEYIVRVMNIDRKSIKSIEGKEMLLIEQTPVPFYRLNTILEFPPSEDESSSVSVVVVTSGNEMLAIGVDAVEYEDEIMIKSLGKQLVRVKNIAGASLLASDVTALILNISDIFKSIGTTLNKATTPKKEMSKKKSKILVVDDSPTTRALLENILEMVGYEVTTAVDGFEAYEKIKKESFDLVVSDVDMPKMNGFELTESIRSDTKMAETPIILVTSLESNEDRERGMHAGANAYIVKSAFDQNNLIENIQLLID